MRRRHLYGLANVPASGQLASILNMFGPKAAELLEAGFHFEEGGCFGMALAITDVLHASLPCVLGLACTPSQSLMARDLTGRGQSAT